MPGPPPSGFREGVVMSIEVVRADKLGEPVRNKISDVFVAGFMQWLRYFSNDAQQLSRAFAHMFLLDSFFVAFVEGHIAGIAACTNGMAPSVRLSARELRRHLGLVKGSVAAMVLKSQFENHPYPFTVEPGWGSVEFVATAAQYRGHGVASAIMEHIVKTTPFSAYVLEVADTNLPAVKLYERFGFKEFMRTAAPHSKRSGINYLVYMKYESEDRTGNRSGT
jgi:ribosomal protein S18 acetylase RimI-like enzyme